MYLIQNALKKQEYYQGNFNALFAFILPGFKLITIFRYTLLVESSLLIFL